MGLGPTLTAASKALAAFQFGIYRAEWRLEAEPEADPMPAVKSLIENQIGLHATAQGREFTAALETAPATFEIMELRRLAAQAAGIPVEAVQQGVMAALGCLQAWHAARAADDFNLVAQPFAQLIAMQRGLAQTKAKNLSALYGRTVTPYEALLDHYDPGRQLSFIKHEFAKLVPICQSLLRDEALVKLNLSKNSQLQQTLIRALVTQMGYDDRPPHGRLGVSAHPFTRRVGPREVWLTGKADDEPLVDIVTMIHEGAHGRYYQGLPDILVDQWHGSVASETINEGMALLAEHMLSRRESFAQYLAPQINQHLRADIKVEDLHRALTSRASSRLRTEASEVSYPLHLALRTELEERLIDGDLDPVDLPTAWAEASQRLLGFVPNSDNAGCLQDIHLFAGYIGYFPCYLLGHMAAAQLWQAIEQDLPGLEAHIAVGDFAGLNGWLQQHIYRHGRTQAGDDLIKAATGQPFSANALAAHLQQRYG